MQPKNYYCSTDPPPFEKHTARLYQGITYVDEGMGEPMLFLHGALSNSNTWRKIIPALSQHFRCIAIDLPLGGHSLPIGDKADLSPNGIARLIHEFLNILTISSVILISNDTGNAYAQVFVSQFPDKVSKLILTNGEGLDVFPPQKFSYLKYAVRIPGFNFLMSRFFSWKGILKNDQMLGLLTLQATEEVLYGLYVKGFIENADVRHEFGRAARAWSSNATLDAAARLKHFNKPVLILWGTEDKVLFPMSLAVRLSRLFPNSNLVEVPNSRTYIQEDNPEAMARYTIAFSRATVNHR